MTETQKGVIMLIKSAVDEKAYPLPEGFSIEEAYDFIVRHAVVMLAYDGAVRCGIPQKSPAMQKLFQIYIRELLRSENQMKKIGQVFAAFEENRIDYLPLKGCNMKALYPKPELRHMGDADILIREEQYDKIREVLENLGFKGESFFVYHYSWNSPELHLEMHIMPVSKDHSVFYNYYEDGWKFAQKSEKHRYFYGKEDEFIYSMVHLAKHYIGFGIGLRQVADIFVYLNVVKDFDFEYIEAEFEKLGMLRFYKNIRGLLDYWFNGGKTDENISMISESILSSGNAGLFENGAIAKGAQYSKDAKKTNMVKFKYLLNAVFPPLAKIKERYKILEKYPFLLPVMWVIRLADALLLRKKSILQRAEYFSLMDDKKIEEYKEHLKRAGFDFPH